GLCPCEAEQLDEPHELVDARKRQREESIDVLFVEIRSTLRDGENRLLVPLEPSCEGPVRVELGGEELTCSRHPSGLWTELHVERIGQGVGRIGRDDEHARAFTRRSNRRGSRARRLANAPLPAEEGEARTC